MTLLDILGLYVGWDDVSTPLTVRTHRGVLVASWGRLEFSCEWFRSKVSSRESDSYSEKADRPPDVPLIQGGAVIPPGG